MIKVNKKKVNNKYRYSRKSNWMSGLYWRDGGFHVRKKIEGHGMLQKSLKTDNQKIAEIRLVKLVEKSCEGKSKVKESSKRDIQDILKDYWLINSDRDEKSNTEDDRKIQRFLKSTGITKLEEFTTFRVNKFLMNLYENEGIAAVTVNKYRRAYATFFSWCVKNKLWCDIDPILKAKILDEDAPEITYLNKDEVIEQFDKLDDLVRKKEVQFALCRKGEKWSVDYYRSMRAIIYLYILIGLRRSEALWLRLEDLDFKGKTIYIRSKKINGKTWKVKSGNRKKHVVVERKLRMTQKIYEVLKDQVEFRSKNGWVFPSPEGDVWDTNRFTCRLGTIQNRIKLKWRCMDFRHTFASHLALNGISLLKISKLMGNSEAICEKYYAKLLPQDLVEEVALMDGLVKKNDENDVNDFYVLDDDDSWGPKSNPDR